jgi:L-threonylcarbamoyladenylate synthase
MREIDLTARSDESVRERLAPAAEAVRDGRLVVVPTMTYYAVAGDALNPLAIRRTFSAKKRDPKKPLIVLVDSFEMMRPLVTAVDPRAKELEWRFGAKGLTYVLPASGRLPAELTAGSRTIAVRIERNEVVRELLALLDQPITAPSANVEGRAPATTVDQALAELRDWVDVAVRSSPSTASRPTTIVDLTGPAAKLVREGTVLWQDLAAALPDAP